MVAVLKYAHVSNQVDCVFEMKLSRFSCVVNCVYATVHNDDRNPYVYQCSDFWFSKVTLKTVDPSIMM